MPEMLTISFEPTHPDYSYSIELSEDDARNILAAPVGAHLQLAHPGATMTISSARILQHHQLTRIGARNEEFPRRKFLNKLKRLLANNAWAD